MAKAKTPIQVETLKHGEASRKNIPTAEFQSVMDKEKQTALQVAFERRNKDLDPQLVWRGKDLQDWSDLVVPAPPLYIQEKVHPKVIIDDLLRQTREAKPQEFAPLLDLMGDFNGLPEGADKTAFYEYEGHWSNRMILGDSLQVMASLVEREGLRAKLQCIYFDPPYGIKFNSNFQWSTTSRDVKDGNQDHITREPEQVKAFRDTWRDGIHTYLTYLRDRLTVARDLLNDSGSIFIQIGDENVHRVRSLLEEVFGEINFVNSIVIKKKSSTVITETVYDHVIWYAKNIDKIKIRKLFDIKDHFSEKSRFKSVVNKHGEIEKYDSEKHDSDLEKGNLILANDDYPLVSQHPHEERSRPYPFRGLEKRPGSNRQWTYEPKIQLRRLERSQRIRATENTLRGIIFQSDTSLEPRNNIWNFHGEPNPVYVVQTNRSIVERCVLLTTDPGDLVLDPTCGSGTTAYVAEQWGRRWITIDTSRVALALARARIMGARFPYYLLADTPEGQIKEAQVSRMAPSTRATHGDIRHGFVYERVPQITLKSIADNAEIDVIWERFQERLEPLREELNKLLGKRFEDWEIPREPDPTWSAHALRLHSQWWEQRIARQNEIDASIAAKAEFEFLFDKPYPDAKKVRVAGPFTVESLTPHRVLGVDEHDELIDGVTESKMGYSVARDFPTLILENLRMAGVQQAHKEDRITFTSLAPWPGTLICAKGTYREGSEHGPEKRAAILIGPEFGTISKPDLVAAAREAGDADFDVLIACAFNFDAHSSEFSKLGRIPVLKARMNADLHMADDLRNSGKGNLFVVFGEPDIDILNAPGGQVQVKVKGVDVFHPQTGEVRSDSTEGIACWFIDTDYNEEAFFVRHAYFLGQNDPYSALKTTLKAEINQEAWESLNSDTSRPFDKPTSGRIAVKVINHLGDEVMKVFKIG